MKNVIATKLYAHHNGKDLGRLTFVGSSAYPVPAEKSDIDGLLPVTGYGGRLEVNLSAPTTVVHPSLETKYEWVSFRLNDTGQGEYLPLNPVHLRPVWIAEGNPVEAPEITVTMCAYTNDCYSFQIVGQNVPEFWVMFVPFLIGLNRVDTLLKAMRLID